MEYYFNQPPLMEGAYCMLMVLGSIFIMFSLITLFCSNKKLNVKERGQIIVTIIAGIYVLMFATLGMYYSRCMGG